MLGDKIEILAIGDKGRTETCVISADRIGRRVEVVTEGDTMEIREVNRHGRVLRSVQYAKDHVIRLVKHFKQGGDSAPVVFRSTGEDPRPEDDRPVSPPRRAGADPVKPGSQSLGPLMGTSWRPHYNTTVLTMNGARFPIPSPRPGPSANGKPDDRRPGKRPKGGAGRRK
ncbi:hypothetical protein [Actinomadura atramentaria]|uniref:hypothetical protein n=1 Tax=Actinomadura atramentaria TaxID=1990 RepID=UPI00037FFD4E|nr:hypothetical protein [Actinomadura atramentaria]